nr:hypothetical protein Iba_chr09eCG11460 [Ipomoea batatas]
MVSVDTVLLRPKPFNISKTSSSLKAPEGKQSESSSRENSSSFLGSYSTAGLFKEPLNVGIKFKLFSISLKDASSEHSCGSENDPKSPFAKGSKGKPDTCLPTSASTRSSMQYSSSMSLYDLSIKLIHLQPLRYWRTESGACLAPQEPSQALYLRSPHYKEKLLSPIPISLLQQQRRRQVKGGNRKPDLAGEYHPVRTRSENN